MTSDTPPLLLPPLLLSPPAASDRVSAICRVRKQVLTGLELSVDSWVRVHTPTEVLLCRAWPVLLPDSDDYEYCQADRLVRRPPGSRVGELSTPLQALLALQGRNRCLVEGVPKPYVSASHIRFSIVVAERSEAGMDETNPGAMFGAADVIGKREAARSLLLGLLVSAGCIVGAGTAFEINILDVDPGEAEVLVTKATRLEFCAESVKSNISAPLAKSSNSPDSLDALTTRMGDLSLSSNEMLHRPADSLPGLEKAYQGLMDILTYPLLYPEMVEKLGIEPPKGVLLHGPPGVGKTYLVSTVARACGASMLTINGPEIFGAYQGESEERLREKFQEAQAMATGRSPCILFIDEMDALTPRRESARSHENRVVAQLLTLMDGMSSRGSLIVVGSTNQPNAIDAALRRPGRFDREVAIDVPSEAARLAILTSLCKSIPLGADVDLTSVAAATNGYVGADLAALSREAAMEAVRRTQTDSDLRQVNNDCFLKALAHLGGPSTQRGATVSVEKLTWDDVGGLEAVKQRLRQAVEWPLMYKDTYKKLGLKPPRGVLLYGPPGCSKTTLVKIIAATSGATFLSLNGAALYSPFVGDSEQAIRNTFQRARSGAPSVVFFDEVDAIVGKRGLDGGGGGKGGDTVQERVLSTLLNEMDGVELAKDVLVVGATNRPDMIDAALMRPGRFDKIIYVPPPDATARHQILQIYTKSMSLAPEVDIQQIAEVRTVRYTGADLKAVCREAAMEALRSGRDAAMVEVRHMEAALAAVKPTLSDEMLAQYQAFAQQFGSGVDAMA